MARYKKKKRTAYKPSLVSMIPIAFIAVKAMDGYAAGGAKGAVIRPIREMTGISLDGGTWKPELAIQGATVLGLTWAAKKMVSYSGANRALKGLPFRL